MESLRQWLPLIVPLVLLELSLKAIALLDLRRRANTKGPRWVWVLVILFVNVFGSITYLLVGRQE
jgi:hypothetical protein